MQDYPEHNYRALINRLRYKHLSLLVTLSELGSLHETARVLHITQPALTRMLRDLETTLGFALFERLPRGMRPTALGAETVRFARSALIELERCVEDLALKRQGGYGQLVIGAIMGAVPNLVALAVAELKARKPLLNVQITGEISDQIITLLDQRQIDLAIGRFSRIMRHNPFDFEPLGNETMLVVVRRDHPLTHRNDLTLKALYDWPWILQTPSSPARQILEDEFERIGIGTPANRVECGSIFANILLVQQTDAVTALPETVLRDHLQTGLLVRLPIPIGKTMPPFGVLTRQNEPLSDNAGEFLTILRRVSRKS